MRLTQKYLGVVLLSAVGAVSLGSVGCAGRGQVRVYDSYHNDYHRWNNHEVVYYNQWETEGHRDHRDFNQRSSDEQKDYWNWRHNHH
jgi:hypothetical protein